MPSLAWHILTAPVRPAPILTEYGTPGRTRTFNPRLSLPATTFVAWRRHVSDSLWSGLSLHRLRCCTYSLYGALRRLRAFEVVSTLLLPSLAGRRRQRLRDFPASRSIYICGSCPQVSTGLPSAYLLRVPRYGAVHSVSSVSRQRLLSLKADALSS